MVFTLQPNLSGFEKSQCLKFGRNVEGGACMQKRRLDVLFCVGWFDLVPSLVFEISCVVPFAQLFVVFPP